VCGLIGELELILIIIGTGISAVFAAIYAKKGQNPAKKARKTAEVSLFDNLTDYREVEKATIADILHQKDSQIKSLNNRLTQYEKENEIPDTPTSKGASWEEITALVKASYPQFSLLLPSFKKQILANTKGMSVQEIVTTIQTLLSGLQKLKPGASQNDPLGNNPNWA